MQITSSPIRKAAFAGRVLTDRRTFVVTVRHKRTPAELDASGVTELPTTFMGYPVEVMGRPSRLLRLNVAPARTEALLFGVGPEEITYQPPEGLDLKPVNDTMRVVAHAINSAKLVEYTS